MQGKKLVRRLEKGVPRVGVIGLGYVGLPLALEFVRGGCRVTGIDTDTAKVRRINAGRSTVVDVADREVREARQSGRFEVSADYRDLARCDGISIAVPTPLRKSRDPDISYIQGAVEKLVPLLTKGQVIVLESTTYPGTTREIIVPAVEAAGFKVGRDIFVAFSPERVDPGNKVWKIRNTPKVVGGATPACTLAAAALYRRAVDQVVTVGSSDEAEMVKMLENTFRAVNIGLVNELMLMCDRMDINIWNVVNAAKTKPFGFMPFYPGPGIGGHCIPLDPVYLAWKAKMFSHYNRFIELATDINGNMPRFVVNRTARMLSRRSRKALNGAKILVLGLAYKPDVDDLRESPGLEILKLLELEGAHVSYSDPHIPEFSEGDRTLKSVPLTPARLKGFDAAVLVTAHRKFNYPLLVRNLKLILDCRGAIGALLPKVKTVEAL
ncbi:MAG: nucleotide sugar dehydrogenase [Deltaproteobacteria bacterium]|nr:nucleotide sugar dehydrogenase [Deltaproteobacteria bacterium]